MSTLADLHRAVQSTLASKRLGRPVFVRYLLCSRDKAEAALARLAQLTAAVRDWLGQPLERVHAAGTPRGGQVSLTLELRGGATALVSWAAAPPRGDGLDLTVLGNRGALYHDAGAARLFEEGALGPPPAPDKALLALLGRALRSGRPEPADAGGAP
jgi:hypothetical protein